MKGISILLLMLIPIMSLSQDQDYIILNSGDTTLCNIKSIGPKKLFTVSENGDTQKYKAKDLNGCLYRGSKYTVGKVRGSISLLKVIIEDDMSLVVHIKPVSTRSTNEVTNTKTITRQYIKTYLVFLDGTANDSYTKLGWFWRNKLSKLGSDCSGFKSKVKKVNWGAWDNQNGELTELVNFYNEKCGTR